MNNATQPGHGNTPVPARSARKVSLSIGALLAVVAIAFLVGFVPMWWTARTRASDLADLSTRHAELQLESRLARAALLARQGEYEAAREAASQFFTELNRLVIEDEGRFAGADALRASLTDRDEIITLLARGDPAVADRLAALYMTFRRVQPVAAQ